MPLENNVALKCSSKKFPRTKYMSLCMENCQNYMQYIVVLQLREDGQKKLKTMGQIVSFLKDSFLPSPRI